jgi:hypothetical protein
MATVDVAGLVTPTYTPTIPIVLDGDPFTQADHTNTVVSLANRTEFVRQLSETASSAPESFATLREDFWGAIFDSGTSTIYGDLVWRTDDSGSPAINHRGGSAQNPGQLEMAMPTGSSFAFGLGSSTDNLFGGISTEAVTFAVKVLDNPANVATQFLIGLKNDWSLGNGGDDCLQLFYTISEANWHVMKRRSGVQTLVDTGVPVVAGEMVVCRFLKNGNDIDVELNGAIVDTAVSGVDKLTGEFNFGAIAVSSGADPQLFTATVDFIHIRTSVSGGRAD